MQARKLGFLLAGLAAVLLAAVGVADLLAKGATATALAWVPVRRQLVVVPRGQLLYDAALDPLYNEGEEVIAPYKWIGKNSASYDPEANNAFGDLPMHKADIKDPDMEFRGMAPKSLATSCDKTHSCAPEENVYDYLPDQEEKTLSTRQPNLDPPQNAWAEMPFDY